MEMEMETKRKLTNKELIDWGEDLNPYYGDWEEIPVDAVLNAMKKTAGGDYDAGEVDWDFDESDAKRMIELMLNEEETDRQWRATHLKSQGGDL